jgi:hypothetical protein
MPRPRWHARSYHAWSSATPVADALMSVLGVASVVIGTYAALFLVLSLHAGDRATALENAIFLAVIAAVNGLAACARSWRRHHA